MSLSTKLYHYPLIGCRRTVADGRQRRQLFRQFFRQATGFKSPAPIAVPEGRRVHARFAAQSENVLQRNDRQAGYGSNGCADEGPVDLVRGLAKVRSRMAPLFRSRGGIPPADRCVIVMR